MSEPERMKLGTGAAVAMVVFIVYTFFKVLGGS